MPAPIAVFAFNRPEHLRCTLLALAANDLAAESDLTIFCDGPRNTAEKSRTDAVREIALTASGFKSLTIVAHDVNFGLASSIIRGVNHMIEQHGVVIVLEDDLVTSPYFLRYMNAALEMYADNSNVASIHGWAFPHTVENPPETFFLKGADCLGWATWQRAWALFEPDAKTLFAALQQAKLDYAFNCNNSYDYIGMLRACRDGKVSSWAVRWRATAFIHDMYTLHPGRSLVQHIGGDGQGTNVETTDVFDVVLADRPILVERQTPQENPAMRQANMEFHSRLRAAPTHWCRLKQYIRTCLPFLPSLQQVKNLLKDCLPPVIYRFLTRCYTKNAAVQWEGDYPNWQSAVVASDGYEHEAIFLKIRGAARAVRDGQALWERDSVLFYREEYRWPLLSGLMMIAAQNHGSLNVLDFGGALGSTYRQHQILLDTIHRLSWNIVEQPHVVHCGQKEFTTDTLKFWPSIQECAADSQPDVILFSGVLQYLEEPYAILEQAILLRPKAFIIDRTPFTLEGERITVQYVSPEIYPASYPCRWLDRSRVNGILEENGYRCLPDQISNIDYPGFYGFMAIRSDLLRYRKATKTQSAITLLQNTCLDNINIAQRR